MPKLDAFFFKLGAKEGSMPLPYPPKEAEGWAEKVPSRRTDRRSQGNVAGGVWEGVKFLGQLGLGLYFWSQLEMEMEGMDEAENCPRPAWWVLASHQKVLLAQKYLWKHAIRHKASHSINYQIFLINKHPVWLGELPLESNSWLHRLFAVWSWEMCFILSESQFLCQWKRNDNNCIPSGGVVRMEWLNTQKALRKVSVIKKILKEAQLLTHLHELVSADFYFWHEGKGGCPLMGMEVFETSDGRKLVKVTLESQRMM